MAAKTKVYIKPDSFLAWVAAKNLRADCMALVLGNTIHLYNTSAIDFLKNKKWVLHELKHVEQYEALGILSFLYHYIKESLKKGYYKNAFEVAARNAEDDAYLLDKYELVY